MTIEHCTCGHAIRIHEGTDAIGRRCKGFGCSCRLPGFFEVTEAQRQALSQRWQAAHQKTTKKLNEKLRGAP